MTKKMKNIDMVNSVNGLNDFISKDKIVPVALSVAISANIKTLLRELEPYNEERNKMLADNPEDMDKRFKELCDIEVNVNIRSVDWDIIEGLELTTKDYMALEFMLE